MEYILRQFLLESFESQLLLTTHYEGLLRNYLKQENWLLLLLEEDKMKIAYIEQRLLAILVHLTRIYGKE